MSMRRLPTGKLVSRLLLILLIFSILYLGLGLGFHFLWKSELAACRDVRAARGEFVEPEVFGSLLALAFDVTFWPVYARANFYHNDTIFATPCTKP
jgi:hypothetical protein